MTSWQDPVALGLAVALVAGAAWLRRWLIRRGAASHCQQCTADAAGDAAGDPTSAPAKPASKPVVIAPSQLRIGRSRR